MGQRICPRPLGKLLSLRGACGDLYHNMVAMKYRVVQQKYLAVQYFNNSFSYCVLLDSADVLLYLRCLKSATECGLAVCGGREEVALGGVGVRDEWE